MALRRRRDLVSVALRVDYPSEKRWIPTEGNYVLQPCGVSFLLRVVIQRPWGHHHAKQKASLLWPKLPASLALVVVVV